MLSEMYVEVIFTVIIIAVIFLIIETIVRRIVFSVNKEFQWFIISKDRNPILSNEGLQKFVPHGYDSELGWIRKPNTSHEENGKFGITTWHINQAGARSNPSMDNLESIISCHGDSFTFSRQVNDDETWEHYLSKLTKSNVLNFGVGNYGADQALLRLKREFPKNRTDVVIFGVVPDTISRIVSMWKHYYEYGNTFGFKPCFKLIDGKLTFKKNPIDDISKFKTYSKHLDYIQENDYFYRKKFVKEILLFPYSLTILKNWKRNYGIIKWVLKIKQMKNNNQEFSDISWNPMSIIMKINLKWRIRLFSEQETTNLLKKIIEEYVNYSKQENFIAIFVFLPQKDDILFIKNNFHFYQSFIEQIQKIDGLKFIDVTESLLRENNLDEFYSDNNEYGGHYSKKGNQKIAEIIFSELEQTILKNRKL